MPEETTTEKPGILEKILWKSFHIGIIGASSLSSAVMLNQTLKKVVEGAYKEAVLTGVASLLCAYAAVYHTGRCLRE